MKPTMPPLLTTCLVARLLGVSGRTVIMWADKGILAVERTASGVRLFKSSDVEALALKRAAAPKLRSKASADAART